MNDNAVVLVLVLASFFIGFFSGGLTGDYTGRNFKRERFMIFCTEQNISYAKCKEEWERP